MKKHITFIAVCALALTLCSCGAADVSEAEVKNITKAPAAVTTEAADRETEETTASAAEKADEKTAEESAPAKAAESSSDESSAAKKQTKSTTAKPAETKPEKKTTLADTEPVQIQPKQTQPTQTQPVQTQPKQTQPAQTKPVQTQPKQTQPAQTQPVQTQPKQTQPAAPAAPAAVKEFHGTANPQPLMNNINIQSVNIYESNGVLVMEAYVINGFNRTVWNVNSVQIQLSDRNGNVFAAAGFGTLLNSDGSAAVIGANSYVPWTFTFKKDSYDLTNADLSMVNTKSACNYNY